MSRVGLVASLLQAVDAANAVEYVAFVPNGGGPQAQSNPKITWTKLEYPEGGPSETSEVTTSTVTSAVPELGSWYDLSMGSDVKGAMLTAKVYGDNMYAYVNTGSVPSEGGCCADTIRVYPRTQSNSQDIDLESVVQETFPGSSFAHASHTFDITEFDGKPYALCMIQYEESSLNSKADAIIAVSLQDGSLRQTALGDKYFSMFEHAGTTSTADDDTRFKVQHGKGFNNEEWHGNGVLRFETLAGVTVLAYTARFANEAVLIKDPFTYSAAEGGGEIVQRFGTFRTSRSQKYRTFGLDDSKGVDITGVHNLWYQRYGERETLTMFANSVSSDSKSHVFEFDIKLTSESEADKSDAAFATDYTDVAFTYLAQAQGGARPLGDGVWMGAAGVGQFSGFEIVDKSGNSKKISGSGMYYDPFVRVVATSGSEVVAV
jgi:hypothetical protein